LPRGYFDADTAAAFATFRDQAFRKRNIGLLSSFPVAEDRLGHAWREPAVGIYSNWLSYLLEERSKRRCSTKPLVLHEHAYGNADADSVLLLD
jgi:hypothetical protein